MIWRFGCLLALLLLVVAPEGGFAVEPKNPQTLCERFISGEAQKSCEKKITGIGPDWYLAGVCEKQFDDSAFYRCLELSKTHNFSPLALDTCADAALSDETRLTCLQNLTTSQTRANSPYQDSGRQPASLKPRKSKSQSKASH